MKRWMGVLAVVVGNFGCVAPEDAAGERDAGEPDEQPAPEPGARPTADDLLLTPRANIDAELVALGIDADHWVATATTYDRVAADFAAIEAQLSPLFTPIDNSLRARSHEGMTVGIDAADDVDDDVTIEAARQLATSLGGLLVDRDGDGQVWVARWSGAFQSRFVQREIEAIEGLAFAYQSPEEYAYDGSYIDVESFEIDGAAVYVLEGRTGDCAEGCTETRAARILVDDGIAEELDTWDGASGEPRPSWP